MKSRIRTHKKRPKEQTQEFSTAPAQGMFQSRPFVVQPQTAQKSQQPDLKTALQRAERYGYNIKSELGKQSKQHSTQTHTNQQSIEQTPTQLKREKMHALEDGGRVSRPVIQCGGEQSTLKGSKRPPWVKTGKVGVPNRQGSITNFKTREIRGEGGRIYHTLTWESSTGDTKDLRNVYTRENVTWNTPAPPAMRALLGDESTYGGPGSHTGLGTSRADNLENHDTHTGYGLGGRGGLRIPEGQTEVFTMNQQYEYRNGTEGEWKPIPNAQYTITRRLSKRGGIVEIEITKRGVQESKEATARLNLSDLFGEGT